MMASTYTELTRQDFMAFFRNDDFLNQLTVDERLEVFRQIIVGSSHITKELLDGLLYDYSVGGLEVVEELRLCV